MDSDLKTWEYVKSTLNTGEVVACVVREHHPFGLIVDLNDPPIWGVIESIGMEEQDGQILDGYPPKGARIIARIIGFRDNIRQVELRLIPEIGKRSGVVLGDRILEVGIRPTPSGHLEYFGVDEVNAAIAHGQTVKGIAKGSAVVSKSDENSTLVKLRLRGFSMLVVVEGSKKKHEAPPRPLDHC